MPRRRHNPQGRVDIPRPHFRHTLISSVTLLRLMPQVRHTVALRFAGDALGEEGERWVRRAMGGADAGGIPARSRWSSEAIPPDTRLIIPLHPGRDASDDGRTQ